MQSQSVCPACSIINYEDPYNTFFKSNIAYLMCGNCRTIFSGALDNSNKVGGNEEISRNMASNHERVFRIFELLSGASQPHAVLDYGCGNGYLVNDLSRNQAMLAFGYDKYSDKHNYIPHIQFDVITMIEVIEHMSAPFEDLAEIYRLLTPGGFLMIETSFTDIADEEGTPYNCFEYINPDLGHCTIFSHKGLDLLLKRFGFELNNVINRNVRIYRK